MAGSSASILPSYLAEMYIGLYPYESFTTLAQERVWKKFAEGGMIESQSVQDKGSSSSIGLASE